MVIQKVSKSSAAHNSSCGQSPQAPRRHDRGAAAIDDVAKTILAFRLSVFLAHFCRRRGQDFQFASKTAQKLDAVSKVSSMSPWARFANEDMAAPHPSRKIDASLSVHSPQMSLLTD
jgi:hypothetical protein